MNAIALGSSAFNVARVDGAGASRAALIATVGLAACFFANAASYLAVLIASLLLMRVAAARRRRAGRRRSARCRRGSATSSATAGPGRS